MENMKTLVKTRKPDFPRKHPKRLQRGSIPALKKASVCRTKAFGPRLSPSNFGVEGFGSGPPPPPPPPPSETYAPRIQGHPFQSWLQAIYYIIFGCLSKHHRSWDRACAAVPKCSISHGCTDASLKPKPIDESNPQIHAHFRHNFSIFPQNLPFHIVSIFLQ